MTTADIVIQSARIFDGAKLLPATSATAIASKHNRIVAIGTDAQVASLIGPNTTVINAAGALLTPGFVDAHTHAAFAGVERLSCDLSPAESKDQTYELICQFVSSPQQRQAQDDDWVVGGGWSHELFDYPTRHELDALIPDRPAAFSDAGHHTLWVNTTALRRAGINADTEEPPNGDIHREPNGYPTGYLNETATDLINAVIPAISTQRIAEGILNAQEHLWSLGITGWHEPILGDFATYPDASDAYCELLSSGQLRSQVSGALWIPRGITADDISPLVEDFIARRAANAQAGFDSSSAKAMVDGVPHGGTAALLQPYCDHSRPLGEIGELHIQPEVLTQLAIELDAQGFALHLHVMGDRGVRVALDAIEAARTINGIRNGGPRHHLAHVTMVHTDDVGRFGTLGVTANIQALWATPDPGLIPMIGKQRAAESYLFRAMVDSGADIAMGSDWPVSPPAPWDAIHTAVNRTHPVVPPEAGTLDLRQALTLQESLAAYTAGSASLVLGTPGRLRVGEVANLALADQNPFAIDPDQLFNITNRVTVVNGQIVYDIARALIHSKEAAE